MPVAPIALEPRQVEPRAKTAMPLVLGKFATPEILHTIKMPLTTGFIRFFCYGVGAEIMGNDNIRPKKRLNPLCWTLALV
jgi:hypothetical protein